MHQNEMQAAAQPPVMMMIPPGCAVPPGCMTWPAAMGPPGDFNQGNPYFTQGPPPQVNQMYMPWGQGPPEMGQWAYGSAPTMATWDPSPSPQQHHMADPQTLTEMMRAGAFETRPKTTSRMLHVLRKTPWHGVRTPSFSGSDEVLITPGQTPTEVPSPRLEEMNTPTDVPSPRPVDISGSSEASSSDGTRRPSNPLMGSISAEFVDAASGTPWPSDSD
jgi:hypothetical protein